MTIDDGGLCFTYIHTDGKQYHCFKASNFPDYSIINEFLEIFYRLGIDNTFEKFIWDFQ